MAASSKTITTVRRPSAPRVLLATRAHVDLHEAGLTSIAGAREVIAALRARKSVTKLILGHNELGDEGCKELFRFLCTSDGRRYHIAEISLNSNGIGDIGLEAISNYIQGNVHLRELFLQNNAFQGGSDIALKLSLAINSSRLELLSLVSNQHLSDSFFTPFLSNLNPPHLRELQISALGLTRVSAPALVDFCTSPRSRALEELKCNGNSLGNRAVRQLISSLRSGNFTLQKLEVHANFLANDSNSEESGGEPEESVEEARAQWEASEKDLKNMLVRNSLIRRKVREEALSLLTYARTLLFVPSRHPDEQRQIPSAQTSKDTNTNPSNPNPSVTPGKSNTFPFYALPSELQLHILSLLAPSLSPPQRARVFSFAVSSNTLRSPLPLLHSPSHAGCIPDPASLPASDVTASLGIGLSSSHSNSSHSKSKSSSSSSSSSSKSSKGKKRSTAGAGNVNLSMLSGMGPGFGMAMGMGMGMGGMEGLGAGLGAGLGGIGGLGGTAALPKKVSPCAGGCMGAGRSVFCHREEERSRWLMEVGCYHFDLDKRREEDVLALLDHRPSTQHRRT